MTYQTQKLRLQRIMVKLHTSPFHQGRPWYYFTKFTILARFSATFTGKTGDMPTNVAEHYKLKCMILAVLTS